MNDVIADGIERYWLADDTVVAYLIHRIDAERAAALSDSVLETLYAWPLERPFKVIFNVSIAGSGQNFMMATEGNPYNVGVTEEGRAKVVAFLAEHPDFHIYVALVVSAALSGHKVRREYLTGELQPDPQLTGESFFEMAHGLAWLTEDVG